MGCSDVSCFTKDSTFDSLWISGLGYEYAWGVRFEDGAQNNSLTNSIIYDGNYRGVYSGSTEFGDPNVVEGNAIWNMTSHGMVIAGSSVVRNNVIFNVGGNGMVVHDPNVAPMMAYHQLQYGSKHRRLCRRNIRGQTT